MRSVLLHSHRLIRHHQINSSLAQVETGVTHLAAAKRHQKRSRKMICCALILVVLAAIAVAVILFVTLK